MRRHMASLAAAASLASGASAQTVVHGVCGNGDVIEINAVTGSGTLLGHSGAQVATGTSVGVRRGSGWGVSWTEVFPFVIGDASPQTALIWISPCTGQASSTATWTVQPAGGHVRAATGGVGAPLAGIWVVVSTPSSGGVLAHRDESTGAYSPIGPTGRGDLVAMAQAGPLYAIGTENGGALYTLSTLTGAATLVGPCNFGDARSLAFLPDGTLLAGGSDLIRIDPATGIPTVIGATGFADIRALAVTTGCVPPQLSCYANCDGHCNPPPCLNVNDFLCFQFRFATGDPYANCDGSTAIPYLNVNDFICFMGRFAACE